MKNIKNKRPQSCYKKNLISNKNRKLHIPLNCDRKPTAANNILKKNQIFKSISIEDNKNYGFSPNSYTDKYNSQIKRFNMYNEMWNNSISDGDIFGISETIKIQTENRKGDSINGEKYKVNATNTRISSATSYCDISYKSKRLIKGINTDFNSINLNSNEKNDKNFQNNKIRTNTIYDINKDKQKENLLSIKYNNMRSNKKNMNNLKTESSKSAQNPKCLGTNTSINLTNSSNNMNYNSFNKDLKAKEEATIAESEYKKILDFEDKEALKKAINDCNTTILNLRTEYLIKLSKLLEISKKFEQHSDYFRVEKREIYTFNLKNYSNSFDKCNDFLLNEIKTGEILDMKTWTKILIFYFNFSYNIVKYIKNIFNEMHFIKNENLNLKQKLFSQEGELNNKNKDISDINKFIIQYDLTNKVKYGKKKELTIKEIKQKYISQESAYILTIFKLEEEIKQLTNVLEKNKYDINNFQMVRNKLKKVEEDYERDKDKLEKQNDEKDVTIKLLSQGMADLNEKITELEKEIQQYKDKEENAKHDYITYDAKITNLNEIIQKKNTIIEELERENNAFKEKKSDEGKMLEPVETIFIPMKEKVKKRKKG